MAPALLSVLAVLAFAFPFAQACYLNNVGGGTCSQGNCGKLLGYYQGLEADGSGSQGFYKGDPDASGGTNYEYYRSLIPYQNYGTTSEPMFQFIGQVVASNVTSCCSACSSTPLCQGYRYFPTGTLDNFQYIFMRQNSYQYVNKDQKLAFEYQTPFPPCWPSDSWCPGYNQNDGTKRCILFKLKTTYYYKNGDLNTTCTPGTSKCYPGVPKESAYDYAPQIGGNGNPSGETIRVNLTSGLMTSSNTNSVYHKRPRSYWGGLCNPYVNNSNVKDDPHFVGGDGVKYDFNGKIGRTFALLTDEKVHINMVIGGYADPRRDVGDPFSSGKLLRSWITAAAFLWKDASGVSHTLYMIARKGKEQTRGAGFIAAAKLDGEDISVPSQVGQEVQAAGATLVLESQSKRGDLDMDVFRLDIDGAISTHVGLRAAHPLLQLPEEAFVHFNIRIDEFKPTTTVHGVLGQTLRDDGTRSVRALEYKVLNALLHGPIKADGVSGAGYLDGKMEDYVTSDETSADCKFCVFSA